METDRLVRKAGKTFTTWRPWLSIKPSANLAGLLALPCRIAEFSCVPPHNEEEKTVDPDELSTTNTKLLNNYFWQMVICVVIVSGFHVFDDTEGVLKFRPKHDLWPASFISWDEAFGLATDKFCWSVALNTTTSCTTTRGVSLVWDA